MRHSALMSLKNDKPFAIMNTAIWQNYWKSYNLHKVKFHFPDKEHVKLCLTIVDNMWVDAVAQLAGHPHYILME